MLSNELESPVAIPALPQDGGRTVDDGDACPNDTYTVDDSEFAAPPAKSELQRLRTFRFTSSKLEESQLSRCIIIPMVVEHEPLTLVLQGVAPAHSPAVPEPYTETSSAEPRGSCSSATFRFRCGSKGPIGVAMRVLPRARARARTHARESARG